MQIETIEQYNGLTLREKLEVREKNEISAAVEEQLRVRDEEWKKERKEQLDASRRESYSRHRDSEMSLLLAGAPKELLHDFDRDKHPNPAKHDAVMAWNTASKHGMVLLGGSGRGKTRTLLQLFKKLVVESKADLGYEDDLEDGFCYVGASPTVKVRYWRCSELGREISNLSFQDQGKFNKLVSNLGSVQFLILDDLGTEKMTDRVAATLHDIVDARYGSGLPLIVSTNYDAAQLQVHLQDELGRTIRRLSEMCDWIKF